MMLLDCYNCVYVWEGPEAIEEERKMTFDIAYVSDKYTLNNALYNHHLLR